MAGDEFGRLIGDIQGIVTSPFGLPAADAMGVVLVAAGVVALVISLLPPTQASVSGEAPAWVRRLAGLVTGVGGIGIGLLGIVLVS